MLANVSPQTLQMSHQVCVHTRCVSAYMLFCSGSVSLNTFTVQ